MKAVVVGASSGLGRCIAGRLGQNGARVALLARSEDKLAAAAEEAGPDAIAVRCDVTDPTSCREAIDKAAAGLGGIDAMVYATGIGLLQRIEDLTAEQWRQTFDTNVIGASLVTAAALPHLAASAGAAAYLSSVQSGHTPPWPGTSSYAVSKAALDKLVEAWRMEHPGVGFTRIIVGDCAGGEGDARTHFNDGWDHRLLGEVYPAWSERKLLAGSLMDVDELLKVVETVLRCGASASIPSVTVVPRPPA